MIQNIALDTLPVPENHISDQETEVEEQGVCKHKPWIAVCVAFALFIAVVFLSSELSKCRYSQYFCPDKWIGFQDHCYYFSNHERNWTSSRSNCFAEHADLTVIDDTTDAMSFLRQHKCTSDHWIGLEMKGNQMGRWVNGTIFNQSFNVSGNETCAYLSDDGVATARCYTERKFICRKKKNTR